MKNCTICNWIRHGVRFVLSLGIAVFLPFVLFMIIFMNFVTCEPILDEVSSTIKDWFKWFTFQGDEC